MTRNPGDGVALPLEDGFHLMRRVLQEHAAEWQARVPELTKPQFAILSVIARDPGVDQATAGERAAIDKSTLAAMLRRLEERGLVARSVDPQDRRRQLLELTEHGTSALHAASPLVREAEERMLSRLSASERQRLYALLRKLSAG
ncbi:MarR family winged helix-turn-helix transcriptional regulator [Amycolatopsis sp. VS8301801F10]|uniref:MarR family winged helix-turn-helix transcriptional regulator n=1 Tax=unclassified Amycolatopsis TaxID=2618356 RepID=UPI0038FCEFE1